MKVIEIPGAVYAAMRALLAQVGQSHADGDLLDMQGFALKSRGGEAVTNIAVSTLLSSRTKEGQVELAVNGELTQMDLNKAREVVGMLQQAIEAAASDQMIYIFFTTRMGLDDETASRILVDFREIRQGSRNLVHPS